jgi:uncharacterized protein
MGGMAHDDPPLVARIAAGVAAVDAGAWDALAGSNNPLLSHDFLSMLEDSGSVGPGTGWQPAPILIDGADGALSGALPAYLKGHSQGEYVFDHGWAEAYEHAGGTYYPKLQIAVPFSPVPGPRLLAADDAAARHLIGAAEAVVRQNGLSSAHATFVEAGQIDHFRAADWLIREGVQFHFANPGYRDFADFLSTLSARKRKNIRKERETANATVTVEMLTGAAIRPEHWDAMWAFYQDTGARKWGRPYLTRDAFALMGERMADRLLLVLASLDGVLVAGALNIIGGDTLYGRYWGCTAEVPCLHFELCYYRAIDFAIEQGLLRVEAGAQGEHKLARGYAPVATWSAHYLPDPGFRRAVADFIARETRAVEQEIGWLAEATPYRKG